MRQPEPIVQIVRHLDAGLDQDRVHDLELRVVRERVPRDVARAHGLLEGRDRGRVRAVQAHAGRAVEVHVDDPRLEHEVELLRVRALEVARAEGLALLRREREVVVEVAVDDALRAVGEADVQVAAVDDVHDLDLRVRLLGRGRRRVAAAAAAGHAGLGRRELRLRGRLLRADCRAALPAPAQ